MFIKAVCLYVFSFKMNVLVLLQHTAKDLFRIVSPLIRSEEEIGEVFVSALGLANPAAFQLVNITITWYVILLTNV